MLNNVLLKNTQVYVTSLLALSGNFSCIYPKYKQISPKISPGRTYFISTQN